MGDTRGLSVLSWASAVIRIFVVMLSCGISTVRAVCPNMCNGHGECGLENVCECESGWDLVADCSLKECPTGVSWGSKVLNGGVAYQKRNQFFFFFLPLVGT